MESMTYSVSRTVAAGALTATAFCVWSLSESTFASDATAAVRNSAYEAMAGGHRKAPASDGSTSHSSRQHISELVLKLSSLSENWDGHGGVPPSPVAIQEALQFLTAMPVWAAMPVVEPSGDGEINFVWKSGGRYLEIGFDGVGEASYLETMNQIMDYDAFPVGAELIGRVNNALSRVSDAVLYM